MMSFTHITIGCLITSLCLQTSDPILLAIGGIASLLPDVDVSTSIAGRVLPPVSQFLESKFPHRSCTHSILASLALATVTYPLAYFGILPISIAHAINSGYFAGWFADLFTKTGIELMWPTPGRWVCPGNRNLRLSTGTSAEYGLLISLVAVTLLIFYANSSGGVLTQFNQLIASPAGLEQLYNQSGSEYIISVHIEGVKSADRQPVDGDYKLIDSSDKSFIVENSKGEIFRASSDDKPDVQIIANKIFGKPTKKAVIQAKQFVLQDEAIAPVISNLASLNPNAEIFLSGTLKVDDPQEVTIQVKVGQLPTIKKPDKPLTEIVLRFRGLLQRCPLFVR